MKFISYIFYFYTCVSFAQAVTPHARYFESLAKKESATNEDIIKMLDLVNIFIENDDQLAESKLQKIKPHIIKSGYPEGWITYCDLLLFIHRKNNDFEGAEKTILKLYNDQKNTMPEEVQTAVQVSVIGAYFGGNKYDEALALAKSILARKTMPRTKAAVYFFRSRIYTAGGDYEKASSNALLSLKKYLAVPDLKNATVVCNSIGDIYSKAEQPDKALKHYRQALNYALKTQEPNNLMLVYANIGKYYADIKSTKEALNYFGKGIALAKKLNHQLYIAQNLLNIGNLQTDAGDYDGALESYEASLKLCRQYGIGYGILLNHIDMGRLYTLKQDYVKAHSAFDSAAVYVEKLKTPKEEAELLKVYADLYKKTGRYQKALEFTDRYHDLKDELVNGEIRKNMDELQVKYETGIKDNKIKTMQYDVDKKKAQNTLLIIGISSLVVITSLSTFFLIYRNRKLRDLYNRNVEMMDAQRFSPKVMVADTFDPVRKIFNNLINAFEQEKIYLNANLSLVDVAQKVGSNEKYVSNAISAHANMNYSNFVNFYRVAEAKRLFMESDGLNISEVMFSSGFNSKTTFYNAFGKLTGLSPKQFKEMAKSQSRNVAAL